MFTRCFTVCMKPSHTFQEVHTHGTYGSVETIGTRADLLITWFEQPFIYVHGEYPMCYRIGNWMTEEVAMTITYTLMTILEHKNTLSVLASPRTCMCFSRPSSLPALVHRSLYWIHMLRLDGQNMFIIMILNICDVGAHHHHHHHHHHYYHHNQRAQRDHHHRIHPHHDHHHDHDTSRRPSIGYDCNKVNINVRD